MTANAAYLPGKTKSQAPQCQVLGAGVGGDGFRQGLFEPQRESHL